MNEARLSGSVIDCDTAATLMEPLTELGIRAGAAILAVDRHTLKVEGKQDASRLRRAPPSSPPPAARSRIWRVPRCASVPAPRTLSCRGSLPGATRRLPDNRP